MHRSQHKDIKTNLLLTGGKTIELSYWDHTGPRAVDFSDIHNNWGETDVPRDQPEKMGTVAAHQELTFFTLQKGKKYPCLKGILFLTK